MKMRMVATFDAEKVTKDIVNWIREWFEENGRNCNAIIAISGGKDSSVVAALCVEALGKDRVYGVLMPQGHQHDIDAAKNLVEHLDIRHFVVNIGSTVAKLTEELECSLKGALSEQARVNLPARIRMASAYGISQSLNGRVANTCNLSEDWVGYSTRYGDAAGDFSPISMLTVSEVKEIGRYLRLPSHLVDKVPEDGLSGKTDEENLGFTYDVLDRYIRTGIIDDSTTKEIIDKKRRNSKFKLELLPAFPYDGAIKANDVNGGRI